MRRLIVCVALALMLGGCSDGGGGSPAPGPTTSSTGAVAVGEEPETFYAVSDHGTEIVEVETATGEVRRTVVDVGPYREPSTDGSPDPNSYIHGIDLSPDGETLWYGAGLGYRNGSIYRLALPDGPPEEVAAGDEPSVSPDGRSLAYMDDTTIRIRDLASGKERAFPDVVGLEAYNTTWSVRSDRIAFLVVGADAISVGAIDAATGEPARPRSAAGPDVYYTPYAPRYRPSDGLLEVACCGEIPDPPPDLQPPPPAFVLHDPVTGEERERTNLPFAPGAHDYDRSGTHHLVTKASNGEVHVFRGDTLVRVPNITGVSQVAW